MVYRSLVLGLLMPVVSISMSMDTSFKKKSFEGLAIRRNIVIDHIGVPRNQPKLDTMCPDNKAYFLEGETPENFRKKIIQFEHDDSNDSSERMRFGQVEMQNMILDHALRKHYKKKPECEDYVVVGGCLGIMFVFCASCCGYTFGLS